MSDKPSKTGYIKFNLEDPQGLREMQMALNPAYGVLFDLTSGITHVDNKELLEFVIKDVLEEYQTKKITQEIIEHIIARFVYRLCVNDGIDLDLYS